MYKYLYVIISKLNNHINAPLRGLKRNGLNSLKE